MKKEELSIENWKYIAETLWNLLAAIEKASKIFNPESESYYEYVMEKAKERFEFMEEEETIEKGVYLSPIKYE